MPNVEQYGEKNRGFKERCFDESLLMFLPVPLLFPLHVVLHASPFKSRMTNPEKIACSKCQFHDHFSVKTRPLQNVL